MYNRSTVWDILVFCQVDRRLFEKPPIHDPTHGELPLHLHWCTITKCGKYFSNWNLSEIQNWKPAFFWWMKLILYYNGKRRFSILIRLIIPRAKIYKETKIWERIFPLNYVEYSKFKIAIFWWMKVMFYHYSGERRFSILNFRQLSRNFFSNILVFFINFRSRYF